ncbi:MAG: TAXI family TRAP transporter solute-binding subunit [Alphaproteobacteria bacterium]|nr:TAXI family TRAP transporter solute-binding subunit [Alphaproteobacteria bacterium]
MRNIELVQAGWVSSALAQADVVYRAAEAEAAAGSPSGLRAIAALYPERLHLVASEESGIHTLADLAGKRVSIDVPGSGTHANARLLLAALGLEEGELELSSLNADEAADAILFGTIDAYFLMAGAPVRSIEELLLLGLAHLVPVEGEVVAGLDAAHLFLGRSEIPAGTYPHQSAMPTLHVRAVWVVPAGADGDLIHAITRALWAPRNRAMLDQGHAVGREITLETATENLPVPLHPGAERFYMEAGLLGGAEPDTGSSPAPAAVR